MARKAIELSEKEIRQVSGGESGTGFIGSGTRQEDGQGLAGGGTRSGGAMGSGA